MPDSASCLGMDSVIGEDTRLRIVPVVRWFRSGEEMISELLIFVNKKEDFTL